MRSASSSAASCASASDIQRGNDTRNRSPTSSASTCLRRRVPRTSSISMAPISIVSVRQFPSPFRRHARYRSDLNYGRSHHRLRAPARANSLVKFAQLRTRLAQSVLDRRGVPVLSPMPIRRRADRIATRRSGTGAGADGHRSPSRLQCTSRRKPAPRPRGRSARGTTAEGRAPRRSELRRSEDYSGSSRPGIAVSDASKNHRRCGFRRIGRGTSHPAGTVRRDRIRTRSSRISTHQRRPSPRPPDRCDPRARGSGKTRVLTLRIVPAQARERSEARHVLRSPSSRRAAGGSSTGWRRWASTAPSRRAPSTRSRSPSCAAGRPTSAPSHPASSTARPGSSARSCAGGRGRMRPCGSPSATSRPRSVGERG